MNDKLLKCVLIFLGKLCRYSLLIHCIWCSLLGKTQEQVEEHDKWYQKLQKLRCEQRREIDEWKRKKKEEEEEEKKRAASGSEQDEDANTWVTSWKKQREVVQEQIQKWKVNFRLNIKDKSQSRRN